MQPERGKNEAEANGRSRLSHLSHVSMQPDVDPLHPASQQVRRCAGLVEKPRSAIEIAAAGITMIHTQIPLNI